MRFVVLPIRIGEREKNAPVYRVHSFSIRQEHVTARISFILNIVSLKCSRRRRMKKYRSDCKISPASSEQAVSHGWIIAVHIIFTEE